MLGSTRRRWENFSFVLSFRNCWIASDWASWLINKLRNTLDGNEGNCIHKWYHFCFLGSWENNPIGSFERSEVATESLHCGNYDRWMAGSSGVQFKVHVTALLNTGNDFLMRTELISPYSATIYVTVMRSLTTTWLISCHYCVLDYLLTTSCGRSVVTNGCYTVTVRRTAQLKFKKRLLHTVFMSFPNELKSRCIVTWSYPPLSNLFQAFSWLGHCERKHGRCAAWIGEGRLVRSLLGFSLLLFRLPFSHCALTNWTLERALFWRANCTRASLNEYPSIFLLSWSSEFSTSPSWT